MSYRDHPLLVPEVILHISRLVVAADAAACARTCKAWNDAFTSTVWHTIDFRSKLDFPGLDPAIIQKHGHRIRKVQRIQCGYSLKSLRHPSVHKLESLTMTMDWDAQHQAYAFDLLRRNAGTLKNMYLYSFGMASVGPLFGIAFSGPGRYTTLRLSTLALSALAMTRDMFELLLQLCPSLKTLRISGTDVYSDSSTPFQHTGLTELGAPMVQVFRCNPDSEDAYSLLAHFPRLETLHILQSDTWPDMPFEEVGNQLKHYCPCLANVHVDETSDKIASLLSESFQALTSISVEDLRVSTDVTMGILTHQRTLERVSTYREVRTLISWGYKINCRDLSISEWAIQLIPQTCSRLTVLEIPTWLMHMDVVDRAGWSCSRLKEVFIRVCDLDTDEKIDRAIQLWSDSRNKLKDLADGPEQLLSGELGEWMNGLSIEGRVARHLIQFKELSTVWLGHNIMRVQ